MIKLIYLTLSLMLLASCAANTNDLSRSEQNEDPTEGDARNGNTRISTHEEQIVESRFQPQIDLQDENKLSRTQAEHLVRDQLNITDKDDTLVFYDHEENGQYIIRVFDPENNKDDGTDWYRVDSKTAKIKKYHKDN